MIRSSRNDAARAPEPIAAPSPTPTATPNYASAPSAAAEIRKTAPVATIGPKIRFKGELVGEEDLLIQGHIDGTIDLRDHNLTIGEKGVIRANVLAKTITIEGSVEGDVYGRERISIKSSSKVNGNLVADRVTLEDGAKFKGSIDMDISSHKAKFEPAATVPVPSSTPKTDNEIKASQDGELDSK